MSDRVHCLIENPKYQIPGRCFDSERFITIFIDSQILKILGFGICFLEFILKRLKFICLTVD
jgi:hypothetical protein